VLARFGPCPQRLQDVEHCSDGARADIETARERLLRRPRGPGLGVHVFVGDEVGQLERERVDVRRTGSPHEGGADGVEVVRHHPMDRDREAYVSGRDD
jgi:hypothetical protein